MWSLDLQSECITASVSEHFTSYLSKISNAKDQPLLFLESSISYRKEHSLSGKATRGTVCIGKLESPGVNLQALGQGRNPDSVP